jgi:NTP pyrophosphatase (non-canonical NTP hydrolase)
MSKEKVFIVVSHKNSLKEGSTTAWEVAETVEFVNQLRNRHINMGSAIGDYLNRKMIIGARYGMDDYEKFEEYVRTKYGKQMQQLDEAYRALQVIEEDKTPVFVDEFGNVRAKTVFDLAQ